VRDDWVTVAQAMERTMRSRPTIYRWIASGKVRTMRPGRALWLSVPDLIQVERELPGRPRANT